VTMSTEEIFVSEHKELLNRILATVQALRERADYGQLAILSAALAGVAAALMDEVNAMLEGINSAPKQ